MSANTSRYCGRRCREALGKFLAPTHGGSYSVDNSFLYFPTERIYVAYSGTPPLWFYGIAQHECHAWPHNQSLALILKDSDVIRYAVLTSNEAKTLLGKCNADDAGQKKLHVRRPQNSGQLYLVEWKEFRLFDRLTLLDVALV